MLNDFDINTLTMEQANSLFDTKVDNSIVFETLRNKVSKEAKLFRDQACQNLSLQDIQFYLIGHLLTLWNNGGFQPKFNANSKSINGTSVSVDLGKGFNNRDALFWNGSKWGSMLFTMCPIITGYPIVIVR